MDKKKLETILEEIVNGENKTSKEVLQKMLHNFQNDKFKNPISIDIITGKALIVPQIKCVKCRNEWYPRVIEGKVILPRNCSNPECNSPNWYRSN